MGEEKDERGLIKYCSGQVIRRTNFPALLHPERRLQRMFCADRIHNFGRAYMVGHTACMSLHLESPRL